MSPQKKLREIKVRSSIAQHKARLVSPLHTTIAPLPSVCAIYRHLTVHFHHPSGLLRVQATSTHRQREQRRQHNRSRSKGDRHKHTPYVHATDRPQQQLTVNCDEAPSGLRAHMKYRLGLAGSADSRIRAVSSSLCFSVEALIGKSITTPSTGCGTIARAQSSVLNTSVNLAVHTSHAFLALFATAG